MRWRISIAGSMMIVVIAALISSLVVFAVRLQPEPLRVVTAVLLVLLVIAAILRRGRPRAFSLGFAIVGWGYFGLTCVNPLVMPTTRWLADVYEAMIGSPRAFIHPDDIVPFMHQVVDFLRVGHAILALLLGLVAGFLCVAIATFVSIGRGKTRVVESRETSLTPQVPLSSLES